MSTVALPTASGGAAFRTEADLARTAARSDRSSFEELFRRHSQMSWRLAHAVSPGPTLATNAVAEGFSQVLRGLRRRRLSADSPFRPALLTAVYRAAMDQARNAKTSPAPNPSSGTGAAFTSLPERWRAAVWLSEVEQMDTPAVAIIIGVSVPVAAQLVDRGRQGLLSRFAQADIAAPDHLGAALRPLAGVVPAGLEGAAIKRWKGSMTVAPSGRLTPASEWLAERAARPLGIACGGLVALGMVGLGVLTVASSPTTSGPAAAISAPPPSAGAPVNPSPGGHNNLLFGPGAGAFGFGNTAGGTGGFGTDALTAGGGSSNPILVGEGSAATLAAAAVPGAGASTPGTPSPGGATNPGSPGSPGTPGSPGPGSPGSGSPGAGSPPPAPAPQPLVSVPGIATVNQPAGGGLGVVVGAPSAPAASVTVTPTCTGLQILNIKLNTCQPAPPPPPPPPLLPAVNGLVNNLLK